MQKSSINLEQQSTLARLLAQENIHVIHEIIVPLGLIQSSVYSHFRSGRIAANPFTTY